MLRIGNRLLVHKKSLMFDISLTSTYHLIETHVQINTDLKVTPLLTLFSYDISNDCKNKLRQGDASQSATLVNVPNSDIGLAASFGNSPQF